MEVLESRRLLSTTVYVDSAAPTSGQTGASWTHPYTTLQAALNGAVAGEVIEVGQGTYKPTGTTTAATFQLKSGVTIEGGFAGYGASNPNARSVSGFPTILSAVENGFVNTHIVTGSGTNSTAVLDGFTLTGDVSAALFNSAGSPTINNCTFTANTAASGAAVDNQIASAPTFNNCIFSKNSAEGFGGAVYNQSSTATFTNCTFSGNSVSSAGAGSGGAIANATSTVTLTGCTFTGNSAQSNGGGIYNSTGSSAQVINCLFSGNTAEDGGAIWNSGSLNLTNDTFTANTGFAVFDNSTSGITAANCIFWADPGGEVETSSSLSSVQFSDVQGGFAGAGNIAVNPQFVRAANIASSDFGNLNLQASSPDISAGSAAALPVTITTDLAGNPRLSGTAVDMGAYEFQSIAVRVGGPYFVLHGKSIPLTATAFRGNGGPYTFAWDFTNSGLFTDASGANPIFSSLAFTPGATVPVFVKVTDSSGDVSIVSTTVTIVPLIVDVDSRATGLQTGYDWTDAFSSLTQALANLFPGQTTIQVAQGTYTPGTTAAATFQLLDGIAIEGGFAGALAPNPSDRNVTNYPTVLSGNLGEADANSVVTASGTDSTAVLDGFTVNGYGTTGGALFVSGGNASFNNCTLTDSVMGGSAVDIVAGASPTFTGCSFTQSQGDGVDTDASSPTFTDCTFSSNAGDGMNNQDAAAPSLTGCFFTSNTGDGMLNSASSPILNDCTFNLNTGGGISEGVGSSPNLTSCTFTDNVGSAILNNASSPTLTGCTITGNSGSLAAAVVNDNGSAAYFTGCSFNQNTNGAMSNDASSPIVDSCTFTGNTAIIGSAIYDNPGVTPTFDDCTFTDNSNGAMFNGASSPTLTDCVFSQNPGGGIDNFNSSSPTLNGCTFTGNGDLAVDDSRSSPVITACSFTQNTTAGIANFNSSAPTIIGCTFTANSGVAIFNDACSPTVTACSFTQNAGTAISDSDSSAPTISGCTFTDNSAGAIFNDASSPTLTACSFMQNTEGGISDVDSSSPTITDCTFTDNSGGALSNDASSPIVTACSFTSNTGGGISNFDSSAPVVTDCTFTDNVGSAILNNASLPTLTGCTISGNSGTLGAAVVNNNGSAAYFTGCSFNQNTNGAMSNDASSPTLADCTFSQNTGDGLDNEDASSPNLTGCFFTSNTGDGMLNNASSPILNDCTFNLNAGNGMENQNSSAPSLTGCFFTSNTGDGMVNTSSSPSLDDCTFNLNTGVGLSDSGSSPTLTACAFTSNTGGGISNLVGSSPILTNCTFTDNVGSAILNNASLPTLAGCTISGNSGSLAAAVVNENDSAAYFTACAFNQNTNGAISNDASSPILNSCTFTGNTAAFGAGMANNDSSPTLTNCTFSGNTATMSGGGIYDDSSNPTLTNCTFTGNSATAAPTAEFGFAPADIEIINPPAVPPEPGGGGMDNDDSSPTLTDCTFTTNSATFGGGMNNSDGSSPTVTDCQFDGNSATIGGGGMYNNDSSVNLTNSVFVGNSSTQGAAMYNTASSPNVTNCTFTDNLSGSVVGNTLTIGSGGVIADFNSSPTITNCIVWGNFLQPPVILGTSSEFPQITNDSSSFPNVTYSDIEVVVSGGPGGLLNASKSATVAPAPVFTGAGNIDVDPQFVSPASESFLNKDYGNLALQFTSPCIDTGDTAAVPAGITTDIAGNPRVFGIAVDMGAYESTAQRSFVFLKQTKSATAGNSLAKTITVNLKDQAGNLVPLTLPGLYVQLSIQTADGSPISLNSRIPSLTPVPPTGQLNFDYSILATVPLVDGVAVFDAPSFEVAGRYKLVATAIFVSGVNLGYPPQKSGESNLFNVTPGKVAQVAFLNQPLSAAAGVSMAPRVAEEDKFGNIVSSANGPINISVASGPAGGALKGTHRLNLVNGIAQFSKIALDMAGDYVLEAGNHYAAIDSNPFTISPGAPAKLVIAATPHQITGQVTPLVVDVEDQYGNIVTSSSDPIHVSIASGPPGATLTGATTTNAISGVADFSDVFIQMPGIYSFVATDGILTSAQTKKLQGKP